MVRTNILTKVHRHWFSYNMWHFPPPLKYYYYICVAHWVQHSFVLLQKYSCYCNSRCICFQNKVFIRSGCFNTGLVAGTPWAVSKHVLVPHSIVLVLTFISWGGRTAALRSQRRQGCGLYSSPLILERILLASWWSDVEFSLLSLGCHYLE